MTFEKVGFGVNVSNIIHASWLKVTSTVLHSKENVINIGYL
jgi:hypothetical protein